MVAYSFQKQFAEPILAGTKRQTIRAVGKRRHARVGDELQLYTGMRTKHCRLLARARCIELRRMAIIFPKVEHWHVLLFDDVRVSTRGVSRYRMDEFARADGFPSAEEMLAFWKKHHPEAVEAGRFDGVLVQWTNFCPA